jgi:hypothetical protein
MMFADFQAELLSDEILLESQQHQTALPEAGSFAVYTNRPAPSNFSPSPARKPCFNQNFKGNTRSTPTAPKQNPSPTTSFKQSSNSSNETP